MHKMYSLHHGHQLGVEIEVRDGEKKEIQLECYPTQPWIQTLDVSAEKGRTRVIDWVWPNVFTLETVVQNI